MSIFQVLSNLNHNGDKHSVGAFIEGEIAQFEALVKDGVLRLIEGAKSIAHAEEIVASEVKEVKPEVQEPENTWGPKPDPKPEDTNVQAPTDTTNTDVQPAPVTPPASTNDAPPLDLNAGLNL